MSYDRETLGVWLTPGVSFTQEEMYASPRQRSSALKSLVTRYSGDPDLSADQVPYHATLVFNAGFARFRGHYVMPFRNDYGSASEGRIDGTNLGLAFSKDGMAVPTALNPNLPDVANI